MLTGKNPVHEKFCAVFALLPVAEGTAPEKRCVGLEGAGKESVLPFSNI